MNWRVLLSALILTGVNAVTACAATWQSLKLGEFSVTVPTTLVLTEGGTDSVAGRLSDSTYQMSYDYGAYSDPLKSVEGATSFKERAGLVDGLAARFVSFNRADLSGKFASCEGVHVPFVRPSGIGRIRLTLVLCGDTKSASEIANRIFSSVKFHPVLAK